MRVKDSSEMRVRYQVALMRTTITLEKDVAIELKRLRKARDAGFKQIVNEVLREGLRQLSGKPRRRRRHTTRVVDLGRCKVGSLDNVAEALAVAGGESVTL